MEHFKTTGSQIHPNPELLVQVHRRGSSSCRDRLRGGREAGGSSCLDRLRGGHKAGSSCCLDRLRGGREGARGPSGTGRLRPRCQCIRREGLQRGLRG
eukprot:1803046-Rhodomonas_salina.4